MSEQLPEAEQLLAELIAKIRPQITPATALVGIHTGGVWLAERLHSSLGISTPLARLDISFYRDDFERIGLHPEVKPSDIPFAVDDCDIILVDDVLHTGRTVRAAINELFDYGRPSRIRLAVLVDRGGRELPIEPEFVACRLDLAKKRMVELARDAQNKLQLKTT